MSPRVQNYVEWNEDGEYYHALVTKTDHDNLTVMFWIGSDRQVRTGKPGDGPGSYREPRDH